MLKKKRLAITSMLIRSSTRLGLLALKNNQDDPPLVNLEGKNIYEQIRELKKYRGPQIKFNVNEKKVKDNKKSYTTAITPFLDPKRPYSPGLPPEPLPVWSDLPFGSKLPAPETIPEENALCTTLVGQQLWRVNNELEFDRWDPLMLKTPGPNVFNYNMCNDIHLQDFLRTQIKKERLCFLGLATPQGRVRSNLKSLNKFRAYLAELNLNHMKNNQGRNHMEASFDYEDAVLDALDEDDANPSRPIYERPKRQYSAILRSQQKNVSRDRQRMRRELSPTTQSRLFHEDRQLSTIYLPHILDRRERLHALTEFVERDARREVLRRCRFQQEIDDQQRKAYEKWMARGKAQEKGLAEKGRLATVARIELQARAVARQVEYERKREKLADGLQEKMEEWRRARWTDQKRFLKRRGGRLLAKHRQHLKAEDIHSSCDDTADKHRHFTYRLSHGDSNHSIINRDTALHQKPTSKISFKIHESDESEILLRTRSMDFMLDVATSNSYTEMSKMAGGVCRVPGLDAACQTFFKRPPRSEECLESEESLSFKESSDRTLVEVANEVENTIELLYGLITDELTPAELNSYHRDHRKEILRQLEKTDRLLEKVKDDLVVDARLAERLVSNAFNETSRKLLSHDQQFKAAEETENADDPSLKTIELHERTQRTKTLSHYVTLIVLGIAADIIRVQRRREEREAAIAKAQQGVLGIRASSQSSDKKTSTRTKNSPDVKDSASSCDSFIDNYIEMMSNDVGDEIESVVYLPTTLMRFLSRAHNLTSERMRDGALLDWSKHVPPLRKRSATKVGQRVIDTIRGAAISLEPPSKAGELARPHAAGKCKYTKLFTEVTARLSRRPTPTELNKQLLFAGQIIDLADKKLRANLPHQVNIVSSGPRGSEVAAQDDITSSVTSEQRRHNSGFVLSRPFLGSVLVVELIGGALSRLAGALDGDELSPDDVITMAVGSNVGNMEEVLHQRSVDKRAIGAVTASAVVGNTLADELAAAIMQQTRPAADPKFPTTAAKSSAASRRASATSMYSNRTVQTTSKTQMDHSKTVGASTLASGQSTLGVVTSLAKIHSGTTQHHVVKVLSGNSQDTRHSVGARPSRFSSTRGSSSRTSVASNVRPSIGLDSERLSLSESVGGRNGLPLTVSQARKVRKALATCTEKFVHKTLKQLIRHISDTAEKDNRRRESIKEGVRGILQDFYLQEIIEEGNEKEEDSDNDLDVRDSFEILQDFRQHKESMKDEEKEEDEIVNEDEFDQIVRDRIRRLSIGDKSVKVFNHREGEKFEHHRLSLASLLKSNPLIRVQSIELVFLGKTIEMKTELAEDDLMLLSLKRDEDLELGDELPGAVLLRNSFRCIHRPEISAIPRFNSEWMIGMSIDEHVQGIFERRHSGSPTTSVDRYRFSTDSSNDTGSTSGSGSILRFLNSVHSADENSFKNMRASSEQLTDSQLGFFKRAPNALAPITEITSNRPSLTSLAGLAREQPQFGDTDAPESVLRVFSRLLGKNSPSRRRSEEIVDFVDDDDNYKNDNNSDFVRDNNTENNDKKADDNDVSQNSITNNKTTRDNEFSDSNTAADNNHNNTTNDKKNSNNENNIGCLLDHDNNSSHSNGDDDNRDNNSLEIVDKDSNHDNDNDSKANVDHDSNANYENNDEDSNSSDEYDYSSNESVEEDNTNNNEGDNTDHDDYDSYAKNNNESSINNKDEWNSNNNNNNYYQNTRKYTDAQDTGDNNQSRNSNNTADNWPDDEQSDGEDGNGDDIGVIVYNTYDRMFVVSNDVTGSVESGEYLRDNNVSGNNDNTDNNSGSNDRNNKYGRADNGESDSSGWNASTDSDITQEDEFKNPEERCEDTTRSANNRSTFYADEFNIPEEGCQHMTSYGFDAVDSDAVVTCNVEGRNEWKSVYDNMYCVISTDDTSNYNNNSVEDTVYILL